MNVNLVRMSHENIPTMVVTILNDSFVLGKHDFGKTFQNCFGFLKI